MDYSNKRIAIFIPSMRAGGAQRSMVKLAGGLVEKGIQVDMVLAQAVGPHLTELHEAIRIVDLQAGRTITSVLPLRNYLRRENPNALISALNNGNIIAIWAKRLARVSAKLVVCEQNTLSVEAANPLNWRLAQIPKFVARFYPWADEIVAVSHGVADDLVETAKISPDRIKVIFNPNVTPEVLEKARGLLEHPWFAPDQPPVILAVGRMSEQKDFALLIKAFAIVKKHCDVRLIILGDGELRGELEKLVRDVGLDFEQDVSFPGFVGNPYVYMAHSSLFVLSSKWEGLPGVLIEAMSCGAPLVATNCPSGPSEILDKGKYGRLVPVGNVDALAKAMLAGVSGGIAPPPPESWYPYTIESVVGQYLDILF